MGGRADGCEQIRRQFGRRIESACDHDERPDPRTQILGAERVCGFGPNTVALLQKCGIRNVLDYVRRPEAFARKLLGKTGVELWHEICGRPVYAVSTAPKRKYLSIGKSKTFSPASGRRDLVKAQLMRNMESACIKLRRHGLSARALTAYLRLSDFRHAGAEARLTRHSSSTLDFSAASAALFDELFAEGAVYRATGVVLSDIVEGNGDGPDLFDDPAAIERTRKLGSVIDAINAAHGKHAIHLASSDIVSRKGPHPRNDTAWRKAALLKGETGRRRLGIPLLKGKP